MGNFLTTIIEQGYSCRNLFLGYLTGFSIRICVTVYYATQKEVKKRGCELEKVENFFTAILQHFYISFEFNLCSFYFSLINLVGYKAFGFIVSP